MVGTAADIEIVVAVATATATAVVVVGRSIAAAVGKASAPGVAPAVAAVADSGEEVDSLDRCPLSRLDLADVAASAIS